MSNTSRNPVVPGLTNDRVTSPLLADTLQEWSYRASVKEGKDAAWRLNKILGIDTAGICVLDEMAQNALPYESFKALLHVQLYDNCGVPDVRITVLQTYGWARRPLRLMADVSAPDWDGLVAEVTESELRVSVAASMFPFSVLAPYQHGGDK